MDRVSKAVVLALILAIGAAGCGGGSGWPCPYLDVEPNIVVSGSYKGADFGDDLDGFWPESSLAFTNGATSASLVIDLNGYGHDVLDLAVVTEHSGGPLAAGQKVPAKVAFHLYDSETDPTRGANCTTQAAPSSFQYGNWSREDPTERYSWYKIHAVQFFDADSSDEACTAQQIEGTVDFCIVRPEE